MNQMINMIATYDEYDGWMLRHDDQIVSPLQQDRFAWDHVQRKGAMVWSLQAKVQYSPRMVVFMDQIAKNKSQWGGSDDASGNAETLAGKKCKYFWP